MPGLDIVRLLGDLRSTVRSVKQDELYQETFAEQGKRKAERYIDYLRNALTKEQLSRYAALSIGGADGSELDYLRDETPIKIFLLNEISRHSVDLAYGKRTSYAEAEKHLEVFPGDIWEQISEIDTFLKSEKCSEIEGLIISAQSVLHEIKFRSNAPSLLDLIIKITSLHENIIFVSTEPCGYTEPWPDHVFLSFSNISHDDTNIVCSFLHERFFADLQTPYSTRNGVYCPSKIALEAIFKISFDDGNDRLRTELEECLTDFPYQDVMKYLSADGFAVNHSFKASGSFERNFAARAHVLNSTDSSKLQCPPCFITIYAARLSQTRGNLVKATNAKIIHPGVQLKSGLSSTAVFHLFDHHFLDFLSLPRAEGPHFTALQLAFRFAYLLTDKILIPSSSFIESPLCRTLLAEFAPTFHLGKIFLVGNALTFTEYLKSSLQLYEPDSSRWKSYAESVGLIHPPFLPRERSATSDLHLSWMDISRSFEPPKILNVRDRELIKIIEKKWDGLAVELGGLAVIPEYVSPIILGEDAKNVYPSEYGRLNLLICQLYFNSIADEFEASFLYDVPYFSAPGFESKGLLPISFVESQRIFSKVARELQIKDLTPTALENFRLERSDLVEEARAANLSYSNKWQTGA